LRRRCPRRRRHRPAVPDLVRLRRRRRAPPPSPLRPSSPSPIPELRAPRRSAGRRYWRRDSRAAHQGDRCAHAGCDRTGARDRGARANRAPGWNHRPSDRSRRRGIATVALDRCRVGGACARAPRGGLAEPRARRPRACGNALSERRLDGRDRRSHRSDVRGRGQPGGSSGGLPSCGGDVPGESDRTAGLRRLSAP
jgi:hypothetical protein